RGRPPRTAFRGYRPGSVWSLILTSAHFRAECNSIQECIELHDVWMTAPGPDKPMRSVRGCFNTATPEVTMNEHAQAATTEPLFNPLSPDFIRDPYPHYERLRSTDPMHVNAHGAFVASRHAEASLVLRDKRFGKDYVERTIRRYGPKIMEEPVFRSMSHWMLQQDPPDHTRLRGLVVKAFTARRVEDMRPRIQEIVDQTLDAIIPKGRMDLIEDFAFRLPVTIICDMLGIPEEHREAFHKGSRHGGRLLDPVPMTPAEIAEANAGQAMSRMYFQQL